MSILAILFVHYSFSIPKILNRDIVEMIVVLDGPLRSRLIKES